MPSSSSPRALALALRTVPKANAIWSRDGRSIFYRRGDEMLIVDCDAHHYENENYDQILPFMENDVLRQLSIGGRALVIATAPGDSTRCAGSTVTTVPLTATRTW
mgnify:CR=1 FL=1